MIAKGVRDTDLAVYQRAARLLLVHPLVTTVHPDRNALPLIRRFAEPLGHDLDALAGYRLELGHSSARLIRRVDRLDPTQAVRRSDRKVFDRRRYAYLCLVLAALGRAGGQVALTELADGLRRRAAEVPGLGFDPDEYRHRLAFVDVVGHLVDLGALTTVEVSSVDWVKDQELGEALYDVDREVTAAVFAPPRVLQHVASVRALLAAGTAASRDTRRAETRQRLCRLLLEHPVVYLDDLDAADRAYLASQGRALGDDLHRLTGGQLERRAEGVALIDATGGFSDLRFPAGGTPRQLALLLADRISGAVEGAALATVPAAALAVDELAAELDAARPSAATRGTLDDDPSAPIDGELPDAPAEPATGPFFDTAWLLAQVDALRADYGKAFKADLRDDPSALLEAALSVLTELDLVRRVAGGVVARPAVARYRDVRVGLAPLPQLSLLDLEGESA